MVACRVFDVDPSNAKAKVTEYVVLGGRDLKQMAQAGPDHRNRSKYLTDIEMPITWYCCGGSIAQQRDFLINKVIPDLFIRQEAKDTQILWIPSHESKINTNFRTDILEVIDGITKVNTNFRSDILEVIDGVIKVKEFNIFHKTK